LIPTKSSLMSVGFGCVAPKRYQFSSPQSTLRSSYSTRSLTAQSEIKKIDLDETHKAGLKVKDDNDYFEGSSSSVVPNLTRGSSTEGYSQALGSGPHPTDRSYPGKLRNHVSTDSSTTAGMWTVAEDYPLMKRDFRRKSFGHFSKEEAPSFSSPHLDQLRFPKQELNGEVEPQSHPPSSTPSPNIYSDHPTPPSKYLEPEIPATPTLPPTPAPSSRSGPAPKAFSSPSGLLMYLPPTCTMSEFHGGIPSLLTHEIVAFVSRIDNFDVTWRRYALCCEETVLLCSFGSHFLS
jgi:hypothetical protein